MSKIYEIEGDFQTPVKRKNYHAKLRGNDLHCYTGKKFGKDYSGRGNVIFKDYMILIEESKRILNDSSIFTDPQIGIPIGSTSGTTHEGHFEYYLREFSRVRRLGSFFPPVLERLGIVKIHYPSSKSPIHIRRKTANYDK